MAIFEVLFGEIWAKIHVELVTPLDARARVSLQRTCKIAHELDPGLILAPKWLEMWREEEEEGHGRGPILLDGLRQLDRQRVFDWCPPNPEVGFWRWFEDDPEEGQGFHMDWTLVPELKNKDGQVERDAIIGSLVYEAFQGPFEWQLETFYRWQPMYMFEGTNTSPFLEGLLANHPRLCHDMSPEMLIFFVME